MKSLDINSLIISILTAMIWFWIGNKYSENQTEELLSLQMDSIQLQSDSIRTLKESLQTSNEKRGRLFLALLYTDIKGKEKALDSLLIEIGKDN